MWMFQACVHLILNCLSLQKLHFNIYEIYTYILNIIVELQIQALKVHSPK